MASGIIADNAAERDTIIDGALDLGPLPDYIGYNLRQAQAALFRDFARRMAPLEVRPGQFSLLTLIERNPGVSQGALAASHGLDKSTMSPALAELERRGLLTREKTAADRRTYALRLTAEGTALLARVRIQVEAQERAMAQALAPEDQTRFIDMLRRVARTLDAGEDATHDQGERA